MPAALHGISVILNIIPAKKLHITRSLSSFLSKPLQAPFLRPCTFCGCYVSTQDYRSGPLRSRARVRMADTRSRLAARRAEVMGRVRNFAAPLKENIVTIPNLLCVMRIAMTPVIGYLIVKEDFVWSSILFALAMGTDLADGFIARRYASQRSMIGSFLDPLADKLLVTTLVLTLTYVRLIPIPVTGLIVLRDILLIAAASVIRFKSIPPPVTLSKYFDPTFASARISPTLISKFNTLLQSGVVVAALAAPVIGYVDHPALQLVWYISAGSTIISGLSYVFQKGTYNFAIKQQRSP